MIKIGDVDYGDDAMVVEYVSQVSDDHGVTWRDLHAETTCDPDRLSALRRVWPKRRFRLVRRMIIDESLPD